MSICNITEAPTKSLYYYPSLRFAVVEFEEEISVKKILGSVSVFQYFLHREYYIEIYSYVEGLGKECTQEHIYGKNEFVFRKTKLFRMLVDTD